MDCGKGKMIRGARADGGDGFRSPMAANYLDQAYDV